MPPARILLDSSTSSSAVSSGVDEILSKYRPSASLRPRGYHSSRHFSIHFSGYGLVPLFATTRPSSRLVNRDLEQSAKRRDAWRQTTISPARSLSRPDQHRSLTGPTAGWCG